MKAYKIVLMQLKMVQNEAIYFNPGDVVTLAKDIPNAPTMLVIKKETSIFKHNKKDQSKSPILIGIKCRWFTKDGALQEATFNTKDLRHG